MFLVLRLAQIYPLCFLGDVLVFDSFGFWGLNNPIDPPSPERLRSVADAERRRNG